NLDRRAVVLLDRGRLDRIHRQEFGQRVLEVAELLLRGQLRGDGAVLIEGRAVVVGGEARGRGAGVAPIRAADDHVVVEGGDAVAEVAHAPLAREGRVGELRTALGGEAGTPRGEGTALGLGDEV